MVVLGETVEDFRLSENLLSRIEVPCVVILVKLNHWGLPGQWRYIDGLRRLCKYAERLYHSNDMVSSNDVEAIHKDYAAIRIQYRAEKALKSGLRALRDKLYETMADIDTRPVELVELESGTLPTTAEITPEGMI